MKIAQCKYAQAGIEITLNIYFDLKAFDFITPPMTTDQDQDFIRLICDSIAAALPRENAEKHFYIKRIFRLGSGELKILLTDGFLIDDALTLTPTPQAYANERIRLTEADQLPTRMKLSNDLLKNMNEKLPAFEDQARKTSQVKMKVRESAQQIQTPATRQELTIELAQDVTSEMTRIKKEIRNLSDNTLNVLNALLSNKEMTDPLAKEIKNSLREVSSEKFREIIEKKISEISPIYQNLSASIEEISQKIVGKTGKLRQFRETVIQVLYEAAKDFHVIIMQKFQAASLHAKKNLIADFNRKFMAIASMSESGELSSLQEAMKNLLPLNLEQMQDLISNSSRDNPGLLQKCNTSFTEESPELKIVLKHLGQLNKNLSTLFSDDPQYANKEMVQIIRIPSPRSFQFKFTENALQYKKTVDDFCRTQKESIITLANQYKKMLQISDLREQKKSVKIAPETVIDKKPGVSPDLQKYKEVSDTMLALSGKDHQTTDKFRKTAEKFHADVQSHIDVNLKSLLAKINALMEKIQLTAENADKIMKEITALKSSIDIAINHFLLHPKETANFEDLDQKIKLLGEKRSLLLAQNKVLQETNHRLSMYDNIIKRIREIDLSATRNTVRQQRAQAKELLLQLMQIQNLEPASAESLRKRMLDQYAKVDSSAADIDKIMTELADIKNAIFADLGESRDFSTEKLEMKFKDITEKMQALDSTVDVMNRNVMGLEELSKGLGKH